MIPLSKQEQKVITLIADGYTAKEIAGKLFLSLETIRTHRKQIIRKLHAKNTANAVKIWCTLRK